MSQDFSSTVTQGMVLFDLTEEELVMQYSVQFFSVGLATLPAAYCVERNFGLSQLAFSIALHHDAKAIAATIAGVLGLFPRFTCL